MRSTLFLLTLWIVAAGDTHAQIKWTRHSRNPVLHTSSTSQYDPTRIVWAFRSSIIYDDALGLYMAWLAMWVNGSAKYDYSFTHANSPDGAHWYYYSRNPIISPSPEGFDVMIDYAHVMKDSGGYRMYYAGQKESWSSRIGLATSPDGIHWRKFGSKPVLSAGPPGEWDSQNLIFTTVLRIGREYRMWYTASGSDLRHRIGGATSRDGVVWTKSNRNPLLSVGTTGEWDGKSLAETNVVFVNGLYYMIYGGIDHLGIQRIGLATSADGITWQKYPGNPILTPQGNWEGTSISNSALVFRNNKFHLWYSGFDKNWQTGYATSELEYIPAKSQPRTPGK